MWWDETVRQWKPHPLCRCAHDPCYCKNLPPLDAKGQPEIASCVLNGHARCDECGGCLECHGCGHDTFEPCESESDRRLALIDDLIQW